MKLNKGDFHKNTISVCGRPENQRNKSHTSHRLQRYNFVSLRFSTRWHLVIILVCTIKFARVLKTATDLFKFVNYDFSDIWKAHLHLSATRFRELQKLRLFARSSCTHCYEKDTCEDHKIFQFWSNKGNSWRETCSCSTNSWPPHQFPLRSIHN